MTFEFQVYIALTYPSEGTVTPVVVSRSGTQVQVRFDFTMHTPGGSYSAPRFVVDGDMDESMAIQTWTDVTKSITKTFEVGYGSGTKTVVCGGGGKRGLDEFIGYVDVSFEYASTYTSPSAVSNVLASVVYDNQCTVSWSNSGSGPSAYTNISIMRSSDGGEYVQIFDIAYNGLVSSFADTSISSNHSYVYTIVTRNEYGRSTSSATNKVYTTPDAPSGLVGSYASDENSIILSWNDNSNSEDGFVLNSYESGVLYKEYTIGGNITSFTDTDIPYGIASYKIKAVAGGISSDWSNTVSITTLTKPAAPIVISPSSGATIDCTKQSTITWKHQSLDNTAQTDCQIDFSVNGSEWYSYSVPSTSSSVVLPANYWAVNSSVSVRVRTKGAYSGEDPWSPYTYRNFYSMKSPNYSVSLPVSQDGGQVTSCPFYIDGVYSDESGTIATMKASIIYNSKIVWTRTVNTKSVLVDDFVPENNKEYTIQVVATSSSSLSYTANRTFVTAYVEPATPTVTVSYADDAECQIYVSPNEGNVDTVSVELYRVDSRGEELLASSGSAALVYDSIPPVDSNFHYKAVARAASGAVSITIEDVIVDSHGRAYISWFDSQWKHFSVKYNKSTNENVELDHALFNTPTRMVSRYGVKSVRSFNISGLVIPVIGEDYASISDVCNYHGPVWVRVPKKGVELAALASVSISEQDDFKTSVSMTLKGVGNA